MKALGLVLCSVALSVVGCGGTEGDGEAVGDQTATLLYRDSFGDGGVFAVVEQDNGSIGVSVQAPIRSELTSNKMRISASKRTLAEIYAVLHDGADAPAEVRALSVRWEDEKLARGVGRERTQVAPIIDVERDKAKADFQAAVCKDIYRGSNYWLVLEQCKYNNSVNKVTSNAIVDGDNGLYIDRSYAWNDSSWTGTHNLNVSTWTPTYAAGTNGWTEWGGYYTGAIAQLILPSGKNGPIGITVHDAQFFPQ
jgi:hypothetical protein